MPVRSRGRLREGQKELQRIEQNIEELCSFVAEGRHGLLLGGRAAKRSKLFPFGTAVPSLS